MDNPTPKKEIIAEAREKVSPLAEKEKASTKIVIENIALITTLLTVGAYVVMYAYKTGYCSIFGIPPVCVKVGLKDYLPMLFQTCSLSIYILWYLVTLKTDTVFNHIRINPYRIVYGLWIIYMAIHSSSIDNLLPKGIDNLISILLSVFIEMLLFLARKKRAKTNTKDVPKKEVKFVLQNLVSEILFYRYYIRTGFFIFAIVISFAPLLGNLVAKATDEFQLFTSNNVQYAIIIDYGESCIAQKASKTSESNLEIDISSYSFIQKDNLEFEYSKFEGITRKKGFTFDEQADESIEESDSDINIVEESDNTINDSIPSEEG